MTAFLTQHLQISAIVVILQIESKEDKETKNTKRIKKRSIFLWRSKLDFYFGVSSCFLSFFFLPCLIPKIKLNLSQNFKCMTCAYLYKHLSTLVKILYYYWTNFQMTSHLHCPTWTMLRTRACYHTWFLVTQLRIQQIYKKKREIIY